jgi:hypothetical protein
LQHHLEDGVEPAILAAERLQSAIEIRLGFEVERHGGGLLRRSVRIVVQSVLHDELSREMDCRVNPGNGR